MTTSPDANDLDYWRVRVVFRDGTVHLATKTEPRLGPDRHGHMSLLNDDFLNDEGDTIGFIDWSAVAAITWRKARPRRAAARR